MRRFGGRADGLRRLQEQFVDPDPLRIARLRFKSLQHQQRHDHRARPVRNLGEVEGKPTRQQHDLDRHHRYRAPGQNAEQRQHGAGEDVALGRAAARTDRLARPAHVQGLCVVADHLEREIGLHAGAHVEITLVKQRPAAMRALDAAQIHRDFRFQGCVHRFAEIVPQQHIFGRDGGVGLELEDPMTVGTLEREQRIGRRGDGAIECGRRRRRHAVGQII